MKQARPAEILIDELVLTGFNPKDRFAVGEALQAELGRLVSERGIPPGLTDRQELERPASFRAAQDGKPSELGRQIARSVYRGFEK